MLRSRTERCWLRNYLNSPRKHNCESIKVKIPAKKSSVRKFNKKMPLTKKSFRVLSRHFALVIFYLQTVLMTEFQLNRSIIYWLTTEQSDRVLILPILPIESRKSFEWSSLVFGIAGRSRTEAKSIEDGSWINIYFLLFSF